MAPFCVSVHSSSPCVPLTRTEAERFMHARTQLILHLSRKSFSPQKKNGDTAGTRTGGKKRRWKDEKEKKRITADIFHLVIFFVPLFFYFFPCLCLWTLFIRSQIHSGPRSGEEARRLHLSYIQSLFLSLLLSHALPLLTFENKSLEFEFQSEQASKQEEGFEGGRGGGEV